jgi:hypothetical protein
MPIHILDTKTREEALAEGLILFTDGDPEPIIHYLTERQEGLLKNSG